MIVSMMLSLRPGTLLSRTPFLLSTLSSARSLHSSHPLLRMPTAKKKRIDPAILKIREERRVRKITKALRKMSKKDRIPRPLLELEVDPKIRKEREIRWVVGHVTRDS